MADKINLTPDPKNANKGTQRGRGLLEKSLRRYGAGRSILADKHGVVIAGNKTLETAADIGLPVRVVQTDGRELVVVQRTDLDLSQDKAARELAYADNRVAQVDLDFDPVQMAADAAAGVALGEFWTKDELAEIIGGMGEGRKDSELPAAPPKRVQAGEVWRCGNHLVACIDSTDQDAVSKLLEGVTVGMVWADPPYGIQAASNALGGNRKRFEKIIGDDSPETARKAIAVCKVLAGEAVQVWWGANHYADLLPPSPCWLVWDKQVPEGVSFADAELAWCSKPSPVRVFRHAWSGWNKGEEQGTKKAHPTQKPIALAQWVFGEYGALGDVIFDPFLGSGGSLLGADSAGGERRVIGCEMVPHYCDVTLERWAQATGQTPTLV